MRCALWYAKDIFVYKYKIEMVTSKILICHCFWLAETSLRQKIWIVTVKIGFTVAWYWSVYNMYMLPVCHSKCFCKASWNFYISNNKFHKIHYQFAFISLFWTDKDESCNRTQNKHNIELPRSLFGGEIQAHFWNIHAYNTPWHHIMCGCLRKIHDYISACVHGIPSPRCSIETSFKVAETFKTVLNIQAMFAAQQYSYSDDIIRKFLVKEYNKVGS